MNRYYKIVTKVTKSTIDLINYLKELETQPWVTVISISEEDEKE